MNLELQLRYSLYLWRVKRSLWSFNVLFCVMDVQKVYLHIEKNNNADLEKGILNKKKLHKC